MMLLPENTPERRLFERADRWVCRRLTGKTVTCSTYLGDMVQRSDRRWYHESLASLVDLVVLEYGHCLKNAGKS